MAEDDLREPTKQELTHEVASVRQDPAVWLFDNLLRPEDDTLATRGRGKGLKIYDEIERDTHAYAVLQKRKMSVLAREWEVRPATDSALDQRAADICDAQIRNLEFDQICLDLLDSILKGYAVSECIWDISGSEIILSDVLSRDPSRFVFDSYSKPRLLTRDQPTRGEEMPDRKFIIQRFGAKNGNPYGLGLGSKLFWPAWFKRQGIQFWLTFADKFGSPTTVGKYPAGATEDQIRTLLGAMRSLVSDGAVAIPDGMVIELLEATRSGSINTQESLARYMDEQISECVLGETLTTNIGSVGSRAASQTHNEVREELSKADADLQCAALNHSILTWITQLNVPGATPPRIWRIFEEEEDLNARVDRDKKLYEMGYRLIPEQVEEVYGPGYQLIVAPKPEVQTGPDDDPAVPAEFAEAPRDEVDDLTDQLETLIAPIQDQRINQIRALLDGATDFQDFSEQLLALYPTLSAEDTASLLSQAMTVAALSGHAEIIDA